MADQVIQAGDGAVIAGPVMPTQSICLCNICPPGFSMARMEVAAMPTAFPLATDIFAGNQTRPFSQFNVNDQMPAIEANRPMAGDRQATTFNILPADSQVQPDMRILANGSVEMRPGFADMTGRPAQINIAIEEGASATAVQNGLNSIAQQFDAKWSNPSLTLVDQDHVLHAHNVNAEFLNNFNQSHNRPHPNPDQNREDDITPPPQPDGGHPCPPGPRPGPGPDDNRINPDDRDRDRDNNDANPNPNNNDAARRTREFLNSFGDTIRRNGGMHPRYFGNFLGAILPTSIKRILAQIAADPDNVDLQNQLQAELTANDGALAREITTNLDRQAQALTTAGDTEGATALRAFGRQLLGEDGPNMAMFRNLGSFVKKVEDGTASATDVQALFPAGTNPSANVLRAITNLALFDAARGQNLLNPPQLPTNPAERTAAVERHRQQVREMLMRLQIQPEAFPNLFRRTQP